MLVVSVLTSGEKSPQALERKRCLVWRPVLLRRPYTAAITGKRSGHRIIGVQLESFRAFLHVHVACEVKTPIVSSSLSFFVVNR